MYNRLLQKPLQGVHSFFYRGTRNLYFDEIEAIPVAEALRTLPKLLLRKEFIFEI